MIKTITLAIAACLMTAAMTQACNENKSLKKDFKYVIVDSSFRVLFRTNDFDSTAIKAPELVDSIQSSVLVMQMPDSVWMYSVGFADGFNFNDIIDEGNPATLEEINQ